MKALIMPNLSKKNAYLCAAGLIDSLNSCGIIPLIDSIYQKSFSGASVFFGEFGELLEICNFIIAVGGDGSLIHSAKHAAKKDKLVLGINAGRLGFLAELEGDQLEKVRKLASGEYTVEKRMMLDIKLRRNEGKTVLLQALNELVVSKGALSKMIDTDIFCDGNHVGFYRADGIIFCTPTGSTAYSLSAGGPIISPTIDSIAMTPICPHSLHGRTILFPPNKTLSIKLIQANTGEALEDVFVSVDGEDIIQIDENCLIEVSKSESFVKMVHFKGWHFYEVLSKKMMNRF
ncbi:MAG: NAD(+)/NADH kinase [Oscillospiraceae bacterium]|jgi:NAD+ kinase|nr:NAD(+)/NADH kinase [Oscillospiraceae bacterium]